MDFYKDVDPWDVLKARIQLRYVNLLYIYLMLNYLREFFIPCHIWLRQEMGNVVVLWVILEYKYWIDVCFRVYTVKLYLNVFILWHYKKWQFVNYYLITLSEKTSPGMTPSLHIMDVCGWYPGLIYLFYEICRCQVKFSFKDCKKIGYKLPTNQIYMN